jgi:hypothetical protein
MLIFLRLFIESLYLAVKLKPKTNLYEETISADCFVCVY